MHFKAGATGGFRGRQAQVQEIGLEAVAADAILAADVAGYSRLMGADEEGTHERVTAHFRELVNRRSRNTTGAL